MQPYMEITRRKRTTSVHFDPLNLFNRWEPWAKLKNPGFAWDGSDYEKNKKDTRP